MGKNPDEIERQIAQKRAAISDSIDEIQQRVRNDVDDLQETARREASSTVEETKHALNINAQAQEHPLSMMTGALGLGVILGAASEGLPGGGGNGRHRNHGNDGHSDRSSRSSHDSGNGLLGGLMMSVVGPAGETIRDELQELVREGFSTFKANSGLADDESASPPSH